MIGFNASKGVFGGDPTKRENGKIFWLEVLMFSDSEDRQKAQWCDALKCFFKELVAQDREGSELKSALRRRHLAYATEKAHMAWLRRVEVFL